MREVPAWVLRLSVWDLVGVIAYSLVFALLETLVVFLGILLFSAILPARLFRDKFVAMSTAVVFLASVWFVFLHYNDGMIEDRQWVALLVWAGAYVLCLAVVYFLIQRNHQVEKSVNAFVERLSVLSFLYVLVDVLAVIVVVIRNI